MVDKKVARAQFKQLVLPTILLVVAIIGLFSAIYLNSLHSKNMSETTVCDVSSIVSCSNLAQSSYSKIWGFPISVLGIIGYSIFIALALILILPVNFRKVWKKFNLKSVAKLFFSLSSIAMLFTIYLVIIEISAKIFCLGCFVSQISALVLFIVSYIYYHKL